MKYLAAIVVSVALCVLALSANAEQWRCVQKNGSLAFTDRPKTPQDCDPYTKSTPRPVPPRSTAKKSVVAPSTNFRGVRPAMTESQVLARAGYPNQQRMSCPDTSNVKLCSKRWVYNYGTQSVVELTFHNGRVSEIKHLPQSIASASR